MEKKYYVPGYGGYIPGDKWKFGSRSSSEPPPLWRNLNEMPMVEQENFVASRQQLQEQDPSSRQRPQTRRQRMQSARFRSDNLDRVATRPMDTATQFPVQTTEMATQAEMDTNAVPSQYYDLGIRQMRTADPVMPQRESLAPPDPARRARPPSRAGQRPPVDARIVNNQRADVLFMANDPFKGLGNNQIGGGQYGQYGAGGNGARTGRYWDNGQGQQRNGPEGQNGQNGQAFMNDGFPTAGYSGHIPGLRAFVGKPYGDALRSLRDSKPTMQAVP